MTVNTIPTETVRFVKELYPRLHEDDAAIERYRAAIDRLPPIIVARDAVLVDGFHRWQAYRREGVDQIDAENLGNLSDIEIRKESIRRNSTHGRQLETRDKRRMADLLYRDGTRDIDELVDLLSITPSTLETYLRDAKRDEKQAQQEKAWDLWLDCWSPSEIERQIGVTDQTVTNWISKYRNNPVFGDAPDCRQHFDVWSFQTADGESSHFGKMPPQIVENLLWLYTDPGQIVVDPFAGGGTTIDIAKTMGRRIWASDLHPSTPMLPIHQHNITQGWPDNAPRKADLILLDPPYWKQAENRYSDSPDDLGNMTLQDFYNSWADIVKHCSEHLTDNGRIAYIVSPAQDGALADGRVVDLAFGMHRICEDEGLAAQRRIIVTYNTQQATGQQVEAAREHRKLLKLYRDLVVLSR